ncbi:MAG: hypothetical protein WBG02_11195 [Candidatus Acidiferrum sp.]
MVVAVALAALEQRFNRADEGLSAGSKFAYAMARNPFEEAFASRQERNKNSAPVVPAARSSHVAMSFQSID